MKSSRCPRPCTVDGDVFGIRKILTGIYNFVFGIDRDIYINSNKKNRICGVYFEIANFIREFVKIQFASFQFSRL